MSSELNKIINEKTKEYLKRNQHEITPDLIEAIREHGNPGKHLALEILDLPKDADNYYLDAFGNRISFNGNRRLKKPFTKLGISPIHEYEIERCAEDIHYYKDNYIKITTKSGVDFPDLREYQNDFIDCISSEEYDDYIGLMGRQSGKSISTGIHASHKYNFGTDFVIGICANKGPTSREVLNKIKNMLIELPIWMQQGCTSWNKSSIENESRAKILTDVPSSDAFRGFTVAYLIVDECVEYNETITVRNDETGKVFVTKIGDFFHHLETENEIRK